MFTVKTIRQRKYSAPQVSMDYESVLENPLDPQQNVQPVVSEEGLQTSSALHQGYVSLLADIASGDQQTQYQSRQDGHLVASQESADNAVPYVETDTVMSEQVISEGQSEASLDPGSLSEYDNMSILRSIDGNYVIIQHPTQLNMMPETSGELQDAVANISEPAENTGGVQNIIISDPNVMQVLQSAYSDRTVEINDLQAAGFNIDGGNFTDVTKLPRRADSLGSSYRVQKFSPGQLVSLGNSKKEIIDNIFLKSRLPVGRPKKVVTEEGKKTESPSCSLKECDGKDDSVGAKQTSVVHTEASSVIEAATISVPSGQSIVLAEDERKIETPSENIDKSSSDVIDNASTDRSCKIETVEECEQLHGQQKRKKIWTAKVKNTLEIKKTDKRRGRKKKGVDSEGKVSQREITKKFTSPVRKSLRKVKLSEKMSENKKNDEIESTNLIRKRRVLKKGNNTSKVNQDQRKKANQRHGNAEDGLFQYELESTNEEINESRELDSVLAKRYNFEDYFVIRLPPVCLKTLQRKQLVVELDISDDLDVSQLEKKANPVDGLSTYCFTVSNCDNHLSISDTVAPAPGYTESNAQVPVADCCDGSEKIPDTRDINEAGNAPEVTEAENQADLTADSQSQHTGVDGANSNTVEPGANIVESADNVVEVNGPDVTNLTVESFMSSFNKELQQMPGMCAEADADDVHEHCDDEPVDDHGKSGTEQTIEVEGKKEKKRQYLKRKRAACTDNVSKQVDKNYTVRIAEDGTKEFACRQCGYFSKYSHNTLTHMATAHCPEKKWICEECGIPWKNKNSLQKHLVVHRQDRPFSCPLCPQQFKSQRIYSCGRCNHECKSRQNMGVHIYQHTDERPYQCEVCGQTFKGPSNLSAHRRQHTGSMDYDCPMCTRKFKDRGTYKQHMRRHMGEKKHICEHCGKSFVISSDLKKHIRIHTGEKPFECDQCGKRFGDGSGMIRHRKMHGPMAKFQCSVCLKMFKRKDLCTSHVKRCHMEDLGNDTNFSCIVLTAEDGDSAGYQEHHNQTKPSSLPSKDGYVIHNMQPKNRFEQLTEEATRRLNQQPATCEAESDGYINIGQREEICSSAFSSYASVNQNTAVTMDRQTQAVYCDPIGGYYSNPQGQGHYSHYNQQGDKSWSQKKQVIENE